MSVEFAIASALGMTKQANAATAAGTAITRAWGAGTKANIARGMSPSMARRMATPTPAHMRPRFNSQPTSAGRPAVGGSKAAVPGAKPAANPAGTPPQAPAAGAATPAAAGTQPPHPLMQAVQDYRAKAVQKWNTLPEWARHSIMAGSAGTAVGAAGGMALG